VIVFATFRDTVQLLVDRLNAHGIASERFVGQATKDAEKGLSQKKQIDILTRFREGAFPVLVATSVGEEGLDVPSTDMVVFYEAVPSEIRSIQRKGRTGRHGSGKIVVLVTKGTSDEAYRHVSASRERAMLAGIRNMGSTILPAGEMAGISLTGGCDLPAGQEERGEGDRSATPGQGDSVPKATSQARITAFTGPDRDQSGPSVVADDRETSSKVVEVLERLGIRLILRRLAFADYAIGDRILIERKTARDLMDTLVDRDLLSQVRGLASAAARPVLIVEGGDLYAQRDIHPNAVRGVLAAIAIDLGVSVFFTKDPEETAQLIAVIARREEGGPGEPRLAMRKSYSSRKVAQERVIASLPAIGLKHARLLLEHFGSIAAIANAEEEALVRVPGIGEKRAREIYALMRASYQ
jgi:ERCC4-type nuclease